MRREYYGDGRFGQKAADELGPEIERLAEANGGQLTTGLMLNEARSNPSSPIRKHITWDEKAAAEKWQLQECSTIMDAIHVRIINTDGEIVQNGPVVICVRNAPRVEMEESVSPHRQSPYILASVVRQSPDLQRSALHEAQQMLLSFKKRLETLEDLFGPRYPSFQRLQDSMNEVAREIEQDQVGRQLVGV